MRTYISLCVSLDRIFNARSADLFLAVTCLSFAVIPLPAPRPLGFFVGVDTERQTGPKPGPLAGTTTIVKSDSYYDSNSSKGLYGIREQCTL